MKTAIPKSFPFGGRLLLAEAGVVAAGVLSIEFAYAWLIPALFKGYRSYSVLVAVIVMVALASAKLAAGTALGGRLPRWLIMVGAGGSGALLTLVIALFLLVNTVGS